MNIELELYARESLKESLKKCNEAQIKLFKRMYSYDNLGRSIEDVVDNIPSEKLDWAMQQVSRTLNKK